MTKGPSGDPDGPFVRGCAVCQLLPRRMAIMRRISM